ncbi:MULTISPECIES: hypothetical protein [Cyanophyceae]|uniref:hypothetical protein n=1 Tax=Cyanophyceae TaxID=3028117 RepID=UPI001682692A|nr:hypothetical protein [Trichocoleus sp. FACHB-69]MBD1933592.1 hypothetical protein [Trichocoleus sp. FACHB-69]
MRYLLQRRSPLFTLSLQEDAPVTIDEQIEELKLYIEPLLACYLAIFDLADTQRRNLYLGHEEVDKDIFEFNNLLAVRLAEGSFKRIGGDKWVVSVTQQQLNIIDNLILAYKKEVPISVGWECRAIAPNGTRVFIEEKRNVLISRAVRCGYLGIQNIDKVAVKVKELVEKVWRLPVNLAISVEQEVKITLPKWQCIIGNLPNILYNCPFCNCTGFNWLDGCDATSYGICKGCGAEVDFRKNCIY